MTVDFQVSVGGDLSPALGSGKDRVAITKMSFLPSSSSRPACTSCPTSHPDSDPGLFARLAHSLVVIFPVPYIITG